MKQNQKTTLQTVPVTKRLQLKIKRRKIKQTKTKFICAQLKNLMKTSWWQKTWLKIEKIWTMRMGKKKTNWISLLMMMMMTMVILSCIKSKLLRIKAKGKLALISKTTTRMTVRLFISWLLAMSICLEEITFCKVIPLLLLQLVRLVAHLQAVCFNRALVPTQLPLVLNKW